MGSAQIHGPLFKKRLPLTAKGQRSIVDDNFVEAANPKSTNKSCKIHNHRGIRETNPNCESSLSSRATAVRHSGTK